MVDKQMQHRPQSQQQNQQPALQPPSPCHRLACWRMQWMLPPAGRAALNGPAPQMACRQRNAPDMAQSSSASSLDRMAAARQQQRTLNLTLRACQPYH